MNDSASQAHVPMRRCRVCRKQLPKNQLVRWVRTADGLARDLKQTMPGRGYYTDSERCEELLPKTIRQKG